MICGINSKGKTVETFYSWSDSEKQFIIKPVDGTAEESAKNVTDEVENSSGEETAKDHAFESEADQSAVNEDTNDFHQASSMDCLKST